MMGRPTWTLWAALLLAACQATPVATTVVPVPAGQAAPTNPVSSDRSSGGTPALEAGLEAETRGVGQGELWVRVRWPRADRSVALLPDSTGVLELVLRSAQGVEKGRMRLVRKPGEAVAEATMSAVAGEDMVLEGEARDAADEPVARGLTQGITVTAHARTALKLVMEPLFRPVWSGLRPPVAGPGATLTLTGDFPLKAGRKAMVTFAGAPAREAAGSTGSLAVAVPEEAREGNLTLKVDGVPALASMSFRPLASVGIVASGDEVPFLIDGKLYGWSGGRFPLWPTGIVGTGSPELLPEDAATLVLSGEGSSSAGVWQPEFEGEGSVRVTSGRLVATQDLEVGLAAQPAFGLPDMVRTSRSLDLVSTAQGWLAAWQPESLSGGQQVGLQPFGGTGASGEPEAYAVDSTPGERIMALARVGDRVLMATRAASGGGVPEGALDLFLLDPDGKLPADPEGRALTISTSAGVLRVGNVAVRGSRVLLVAHWWNGSSWGLRFYGFDTAGGRLINLGSDALMFAQFSLRSPAQERLAVLPWGAGYLVLTYGQSSGQNILVMASVDEAGKGVSLNAVGITSEARYPVLVPRPGGGAWLAELVPQGSAFATRVRGMVHPTGALPTLDAAATDSLVLPSLPGAVGVDSLGVSLVDPVVHAPSAVAVGEDLLIAVTARRPGGTGERPVLSWVRPHKLDAEGEVESVAVQTHPLADEGAAVRLSQAPDGEVRAIWRTQDGRVKSCRIVVPRTRSPLSAP